MNKLLLVIILFTGTGLLFGCSADVTDDQYLVNAQKYIDSGKMKAALIEMKNLLQNNPDNPQGRLLMGRLQFEMGNMAASEKALNKARELGVEDELTLPLLAQALLLQGKGAEVLSLSLANLNDKGQAEVLAAQGRVQLGQGKVAEAASQIEKAISKDPSSVNALIASASIHATNQEFDLARKQLAAASLIDPKSAAALSMLADIEWQEGNPDLEIGRAHV